MKTVKKKKQDRWRQKNIEWYSIFEIENKVRSEWKKKSFPYKEILKYIIVLLFPDMVELELLSCAVDGIPPGGGIPVYMLSRSWIRFCMGGFSVDPYGRGG